MKKLLAYLRTSNNNEYEYTLQSVNYIGDVPNGLWSFHYPWYQVGYPRDPHYNHQFYADFSQGSPEITTMNVML